jgi:hypothetical protein
MGQESGSGRGKPSRQRPGMWKVFRINRNLPMNREDILLLISLGLRFSLKPGGKPELRLSDRICPAAAGLPISPSPGERRDGLPGFGDLSLPPHQPGRCFRQAGCPVPVLQRYAGRTGPRTALIRETL